jgi:hypothetical protein
MSSGLSHRQFSQSAHRLNFTGHDSSILARDVDVEEREISVMSTG